MCKFSHADKVLNVKMHGELHIPVSLCPGPPPQPSRILLSNKLSPITWRKLNETDNVHLIYNDTTDAHSFYFLNVTDSFLFLEFCQENAPSNQNCENNSLCCRSWDKFVSRTCVNVTGEVSRTCVNVTGERSKSYPHYNKSMTAMY